MKKIAIIFFSLILTLAVGVGVAFYLGNRPEVIYHPNGKIKSITQRKFFEKDGDQSVFTLDGTLSHQYTLVKGVKTGKAKVYSSSFNPIELTYNNDALVGDVIINKNDIPQEIEELKISTKPNNSFIVNIKNSGISAVLEGKVMCASEDFILKGQQLSIKKSDETLKNFLGCISFTSFTIGNEELQCTYNGQYKFPKFTTNSNFTCAGKLLEEESFKDLENVKITATYNIEKEALIFQTTDLNNPSTVANSSFKGIENMLESIIYFLASQNKEQDSGKLVANLIENFTVSSTNATINNQKVASIEGDFNIVNGFSNPYVISYYTNNSPSTQIKISNEGISLKSKYPANNKPMVAFSINVDETIKNKYKEVITSLLDEVKKSSNVQDEALVLILSKWTDYAWTFSDVIKSVNAIVWNNKGEKVIAATATVQQNISIDTFLEDMAKYVDFKVLTYKNNQPVKVCKGNLYDGFTINGEPATLDDVIALAKTSDLEKTVNEIGEELAKLYSGLEDEILQGTYKTIDPFLFGLYKGYSSAMQKYTQNKTSEQFSYLIENVKLLFSGIGHYNDLNNDVLIASGFFPEDMIVNTNGAKVLTNASGGLITLLGSKTTSIEDNQADKRSFIIEFGGLSKELCIELSTSYMLSDEKLVAIAAGVQKNPNSNNSLGTIGSMADKIYIDVDSKSSAEGLSYISKTSLPFAFAINACIDENNNNAVAYKYTIN